MNPNYEAVGEEFVKAFYQEYDVSATQEQRAQKLMNFYHPDALFIFEDTKVQGREAIVEKIKNLGFTRAVHAITKADFQPLMDGGVLIMVTGQLKVDEDRPLGFSHVFMLRNESGNYFIMHEIFRLALHNFEAQQQ